MKKWQKNHLTSNLGTLVEETVCNQIIFSHLIAEGVLAKVDVERIESKNGDSEQAAELYNFVETRINGYVEMAVALAKVNQSKPCKVFMDGLARHADTDLIVDFLQKTRHLHFFRGPEMKSFLSQIKTLLKPDYYKSLLLEAGQQKRKMDSDEDTDSQLAVTTDGLSGPGSKKQRVEIDSADNATKQLVVKDAPSSSSQVTQPTTRESITFSTEEPLGQGSGGTFVYKGSFGFPARPVAVKVISSFKDKNEALEEIKKLIKFENHENIVGYLGCNERTDNSILIALELCNGTLEELINRKVFRDQVLSQVTTIDEVDICRQIASGVQRIHAKKFIHRDLKPNNVLIKLEDGKLKIKISDFGISRVLNNGRISRTFTSAGGTEGWMAPETLMFINDPSNGATVMRMGYKTDVFALGCIIYYVLTNGKHIFGDNLILRNANILMGRPEADANHPSIHVRSNLPFILSMVAPEPSARPDSLSVLGHFIFWTPKEKLQFVVDVSNLCEGASSWSPKPDDISRITDEKLAKKAECIRKLQDAYGKDIIDDQHPEDGWFYFTEDPVYSYLKKDQFTKKNHSLVMGLMRVIRNLNNHYEKGTLQENIKQSFGDMPDGFINYWMNIFPLLIHHVREAFSDYKDDPRVTCLKPYYKNY